MSEQKPGNEADETLLRQEPNKSAKPKASESVGPEPAGETLLRTPESSLSSDSTADASDETVIRSDGVDPLDDRNTSVDPSHGSDDATILRHSDELSPLEKQPTGAAAETDDSTILIEPESQSAAEADDATVVRGNFSNDVSSDSATIVREPVDGQATILRSGDQMRTTPPEAATILRDGSEDLDDDRTVINNPDDDATIIGGGGDTTVFANAEPSLQPARSNTEAGRLLKNRFVLEEKVGSGGMGDVYKALDLRQQEAQERNPYIAIKILNESFSRHKDAFISLQRETTRTRGIPHPNIMAVYDFDKEGDTVFMSMELLDGKPLDDYLKENPEGVSVDDAWNIIDGICQGLGRAHGAGIVHSDFKPGNIYYTTEKNCKVFDFGIARAVSNPGELEADGEKTVFDAGSLGALTPTYASYEMLKGLEPTKSDDVYAVALVAYELFTGKHPYNRVPADKALDRGIEPEAPPNLKRRHWKALRKALEIKGEDRTQTIDEFYEGMFSEDPPYLRNAAIAAVLTLSVGFGVYQQFFRAAEVIPEEFTEYMTSYTSADGNISSRLKAADWQSKNWHDAIETGINQMSLASITMMEQYPDFLDAEWEENAGAEISGKRAEILQAYLGQIATLRSNADTQVIDTGNKEQVQLAVDTLQIASGLLAIVKERYNFDPEKIGQEEVQLVSRVDLRNFQFETIENKEVADAAAAEAAEAAEKARLLAIENERIRNESYDANLAEFRDILRCKGDIDNSRIYGDEGLEGIISNLATIYPARFNLDKPGIVDALAGCIEQRVAVRAPERARTIKAAVTSYLPSESRLREIEIVDLDPCAKRGLAGQGSRNRQWCEDQLAAGGTGPEMVVIPKRQGRSESEPLGANFALSRVEIRIGDYNQFCEDAGCQKLGGPSAIPATNVSLEQVQAYAAWLSDQSGKAYRIPTADEWLYAATTNGTAKVDDNVNCTVDSRGVRLGERLLNTLSGRPNDWGLYNHVGNAREWALNGEELVALGGAHTDPKAECTMAKSVTHTGQADPVTGFRLVREIQVGDGTAELNSAD